MHLSRLKLSSKTNMVLMIFVSIMWVLPPFLTVSQNALTLESDREIVYPLSVFLNFFASLLLFLILSETFPENKSQIFKKHSVILITFGSIFVLAGFFELLCFLKLIPFNDIHLAFPKTPLKIANCISGTFFAAFFEEFLYRFYLPESLLSIFSGKRLHPAIIEIAVILIFAFSHFYRGWTNVIFAFLCGIILRWSFKNTKSLVSVSIIHGLYNLSSIFASSFF